MPKYKIYKIKQLPSDFNLVGCKLGKQFICSGWNRGFWTKNDEKSSQIFPVFFKDFDQIKDWKVGVPIDRVLQIELSKRLKK